MSYIALLNETTANFDSITLPSLPSSLLSTDLYGTIQAANVTYPLTFSSNNLGLGYNSTNLKLTSNLLNTIQDIATTSSPTFSDLTLSSLSGSGYAVVTNSSNLLTSLQYTSSNIASTIVSRDANGNTVANNFTSACTSTAASGSPINLNPNATRYQQITGTGNQTIKLANATQLAVGSTYVINNNATGTVTVNNNSNTLITTVPSGGYKQVLLTDNSAPSGTWDSHSWLATNATSSTAGLTITGYLYSGATNTEFTVDSSGNVNAAGTITAYDYKYSDATASLRPTRSTNTISIGNLNSAAKYQIDTTTDLAAVINPLIASDTTFFLFAGRYYIASSIDLSNVSRCVIKGESKERTYIYTAAGIDGFLMDRTAGSSSVTDNQIRDIAIIHGPFPGSITSNTGKAAIKLGIHSQDTFQNIYIRYFDYGIYLVNKVFYSRWINIKCQDCTTYSCYISYGSDDRCNENAFVACVFIGNTTNPTQDHIYIERGNSNGFVECTLENWQNSAFRTASDTLSAGNRIWGGRMESNNVSSHSGYAIIFGTLSQNNSIYEPYVAGNNVNADAYINYNSSTANWFEGNNSKGSSIYKSRTLLTAGDFITYTRTGSGDAKSILTLNDTYTPSGTPTTFKVNIARALGLYCDFQRSGVSHFSVDGLGNVNIPIQARFVGTSTYGLIKNTDSGNNCLFDFDCLPVSTSDSGFIRLFRNSNIAAASFNVHEPNTNNANHRLQVVSGGSFVCGQTGYFGIGTNAPLSNAELTIVSTLAYGTVMEGTQVNQTGGTMFAQYLDGILAPTANLTVHGAAISTKITYDPALGTTMTNASQIYIDAIAQGAAGGTITNSYGLYAKTPLAGTNRYAAYLQNLTINAPTASLGSFVMWCSGTSNFTGDIYSNSNVRLIGTNTYSTLKNTDSGNNSIMDIDSFPVANTDTVNIRMFRNTDASAVGFNILEPNTTNTQHRLQCVSGGSYVCGQTGIFGIGTTSPVSTSELTIVSSLAYGLLQQGTQTTQTGGNQFTTFINSTLAPAASLSGFNSGLAIGVTYNPASSTTTTNAACIYVNAVAQGAAGGTITNSYGIYAKTPLAGTNKYALYADNASFGGATPSIASYKLYVTGTSYFSSDITAENYIYFNGTSTTAQIRAVDSGNNCLWDFDSTPVSTSDSCNIRIFRNSNIAAANFNVHEPNTTNANHRLQVVSGTSFLNAQTGILAIGTNSATSSAQLTLSSTLANSMIVNGTQVSQAGNSMFGINVSGTLAPTANLTSFGCGLQLNEVLDPANATTVTNSAQLLINNPSQGSGGGTVTNSYGAYIKKPAFGTKKIATYSEDMTIGASTVVPPTNGLYVEGNIICNGTVSGSGNTGTYTPTFATLTQITSVTNTKTMYFVVGTYVTVISLVSIVFNMTTTGSVGYTMTLPIAPNNNFGSYEFSGSGIGLYNAGNSYGINAFVQSNPASNTALINFNIIGLGGWAGTNYVSVRFTYDYNN